MVRAKTRTSPARDKDERIAAYKALMRDAIDRRPSGMRLKIATAIGKHKSFVSQITNPAYPVPIPARHLETIFKICHFSPEERDSFLAAYGAAHPGQSDAAEPAPGRPPAGKILEIELPAFKDADTAREVEQAIQEMAARLIALAARRG